jgi:hypothetical protein
MFSSVCFAQTLLPTTTVVAPKERTVRTRSASHPVPAPKPAIADLSSGLPAHSDPAYPNIHVRDWNAPGMLNLHYMSDVQFAAFKAMHPTTAFYGRCYAGQDPDENIRAWLRSRKPIWCEVP